MNPTCRRRILAGASLGAAAILAAAVSATAIASPDASIPYRGTSVTTPALPLGHAGRWMTDGKGRVVIIHGINVSMKGTLAASQAYQFGPNDAKFLATNGFNAVRLTVERYDIEPSPGHFNMAYLKFVQHIVRTLWKQHVMTLIDFHQDEFGPTFDDNGYPAWMTDTGGLPNVHQVGFPFQYLANPALNHAFDELWADGDDTRGNPLWNDDANILSHAAAVLHDTRGVLGYEILNEPWPGTIYPTCANLAIGCPSFDKGPVSHYYAAMTSAIRSQDKTHLVFYEPLVLFNYGFPTNVTPPAGREIGFAFHDYPLCSASDDAGLPISLDTDCGAESALVLHNALTYDKKTQTALLETEWGATTNAAAISQSVDSYDTSMIPWLYWSYSELDGGTTSTGAFVDPTETASNFVLHGLARAYPQLISGTPTSWDFDDSTSDFTFDYTTAKAAGGQFARGSITDISTPSVTYPDGYVVKVTGGTVVSERDAPVLKIASRASSVTVTVTPTT